MTHFDTVDFYTDKELVENPYPYFEYLRSQGPIARLPQRNVLAVTGYAEALEIVNDPKTFSSANSATGPIPELPFEPEGDDIQEQLDAHRDEMLATGLVVAKDGKEHADHRSLMMNLFTPTRLKANEEYMWDLTDKLINEFVDQGKCDLIAGDCDGFVWFLRFGGNSSFLWNFSYGDVLFLRFCLSICRGDRNRLVSTEAGDSGAKSVGRPALGKGVGSSGSQVFACGDTNHVVGTFIDVTVRAENYIKCFIA